MRLKSVFRETFAMKIQLVSIEKDGIIHLRIDGRITTQDFLDGQTNPLETAIGTGWAGNRILMDMGSVEYADSSAVGWLLLLHKGFKTGGGAMVLFGLPASVMQVFVLLNLRSVLKFAESETAARELLAVKVP
jgi:anti-anti-sigma factor